MGKTPRGRPRPRATPPSAVGVSGGAPPGGTIFLGRPLGLGDPLDTEASGTMGCTVGWSGATGTAKGITERLDLALGGRPRRLSPLEIPETDLGLGGRPNLLDNLDLETEPGGRPLRAGTAEPGLTPRIFLGRPGPLFSDSGAGAGSGSSDRPSEAQTGSTMGWGFGLGGLPRVL